VTLVSAYDLVILDLDGVVYLIDQPIPGAAEAVAALHARGTPVAFATNNASRRAPEVAGLLGRVGVPAGVDEVVTSAQAAAAALATRHGAGAPVLVVGAEALRAEVRDAGLRPVETADAGPVAVVQGYAPDVGWPQLAEACVAIRAGADWVATNTDTTLPSPRGPLPGNGALVAALRTALDRGPDLIVGKPEPGLFRAAAARVGAARPLVVGDRLDTDIEGAARSGMDSLLVLTGIATARDLLAAPAGRRPVYVATDLSGLCTVDMGERLRPTGDRSEVGGWVASRDGGRIRLDGTGTALDALRALCGVAWSGPSGPSGPSGVDVVDQVDLGDVVAGSAAAATVLESLGLGGRTVRS